MANAGSGGLVTGCSGRCAAPIGLRAMGGHEIALPDDFLACWTTQRDKLSLIHWFPHGACGRTACSKRFVEAPEDLLVQPGAALDGIRMCFMCLKVLRRENRLQRR